MAICSIDGCAKPARARGWCQMHYRRWKRHDSPSTVLPGRGHPKGQPPWNKGKTMSEKTRARLSTALTGYKFSVERNRKIGDAHRGKPKSPEHVAKISGPNHYAWKGGRSRPMNRTSWRKLRARVLERDNHTCQECGKTGCQLVAHHIIPWPDGPDTLNNLIAWCRSCHTRYHCLNP